MPWPHSAIASKFWSAACAILPDGPAVNTPLWKKYLDSLSALRDGVFGRLEWSGDFAVSGSAANNFTVELGAISCAWVYDGTNYVPLAYGGGTITQTSVYGGGGTLGAAVDWWHVYIYSNAGTAAFEISQTEPNAARVFKSGDNTRRYLGRFRTDASGVPLAVRALRGRYLYRVEQAVEALGVATSRTSVIVRPGGTAGSEEPLIPADARVALMDFKYNAASGADRTLGIYHNNETTVSTSLVAKNLGAAYVARLTAEVEVDGSQQFGYYTSHAGSSMDAYCRGWVE